VQFGIFMLATDQSMSVIELGRAAEAAGFSSLFLGEHTHMPVGTGLPGAGVGGQEARLLDPFVALSAVAATTTRLRVGTGVCLVIERDPITLAKEVASLDFLSGGRFELGVAAGWNQREMRNHGTDPASRWKLLRERIEAMKRIWAEDEAEFHGKLVDFGPLWSWPKPVQKPHPPILVGGSGAQILKRIAAYGDGWMPYAGRHLADGSWRATGSAVGGIAVDDFITRGRELRRLAKDAGRGRMSLTLFGAPDDPAQLERLQAADVDRCLFWLPAEPAATVLPILERCAKIAASFA